VETFEKFFESSAQLVPDELIDFYKTTGIWIKTGVWDQVNSYVPKKNIKVNITTPLKPSVIRTLGKIVSIAIDNTNLQGATGLDTIKVHVTDWNAGRTVVRRWSDGTLIIILYLNFLKKHIGTPNERKLKVNGFRLTLKILSHELRHIEQLLHNKLDVKGNKNVRFKNQQFKSNIKDIGHAAGAGYNKLPWEREANREGAYSMRKASKYFRQNHGVQI
jgi:hypothetical protein